MEHILNIKLKYYANRVTRKVLQGIPKNLGQVIRKRSAKHWKLTRKNINSYK